MAISKIELLDFLRRHYYAVQSTVNEKGFPQSAVVGFAVTDDFEMVFDTLLTTRKARNLLANPHVAFAVCSLAKDAQYSVQYEGIARQLQSGERERMLDVYFKVFPDGRERLSWEDITHFVVQPTWIRYLDYKAEPPNIVELDQGALHALSQGQNMAY
jgi:nitroimidazol reductase NimA-like FMN-containing flavoprotein (pyridoxamine 5'-phosphate oxidase superfamily)